MIDVSPMLIAIVVVLVYLVSCIHILKEYERAVVFRLGKLLSAAKGPGLIFVFRPIDTIVKVSLRTAVHDVPPQDIITRDNVSVKVNAVVYYRVIDPRPFHVSCRRHPHLWWKSPARRGQVLSPLRPQAGSVPGHRHQPDRSQS